LERSGAGPPLLFVHGTTADHKSWFRVSPALEQHFTVHAMDRRGRGASGDAPNYEFIREAEDVAAVLEAIGEPAFLFGHSYGGLCALEAVLLTDRVSRLILYEPEIPTGIPSVPPNMIDRLQALVDSGELEPAMEYFFREIVKVPAHEFEFYRQSPLWQERIPLAATIPRELAIDRLYRFDADRFANFQIPTMLMVGGDSPQFIRQAVELVDAALPQSQIVVLPEEQHMAHHTNPELFVREVVRFLSEQQP
jgi:pimeloyl-ACP methyl ester carboxylesterase